MKTVSLVLALSLFAVACGKSDNSGNGGGAPAPVGSPAPAPQSPEGQRTENSTEPTASDVTLRSVLAVSLYATVNNRLEYSEFLFSLRTNKELSKIVKITLDGKDILTLDQFKDGEVSSGVITQDLIDSLDSERFSVDEKKRMKDYIGQPYLRISDFSTKPNLKGKLSVVVEDKDGKQLTIN